MVDRICDNCMSKVPADSEKCPRCGIHFENTNPGGALPNGWVLGGRYTVGRYIDIDGEGVLYSAIDGNTLQRVTIKEYMPVTLCATRDEAGSIVAKPGNEVLFKTTRMDFRELYDSLLRMGLTEGLVQVLDVLEENNTAYAVLEKVEGPTLAEYLTKFGVPVDGSRAMAVLRPVMMGVEAMHAANLVHRGISPENIILESGGTAKLGGFAILALRQQGSELKPKLYPGYSAPEQYSASEFEGRYTDIYAIGGVLYRMVTGEPPQPADERKVQDSLRPARTENKEVPTFLSAGIARAMRLLPDERIQTVGDLRLALAGEAKRSAGSRGPLGLTKQQLIIGASALGAIVLILLVVLLMNVFGGKRESTTTTTTSFIASGVENPVDNFVGQTRTFIENKFGGEYDITWDEGYSDEYPEGYVYRQDPQAGTEKPADGRVTVWVSLGEDPDGFTESMPDFVTRNTSREDAERALIELGFESNQLIFIEEDNNGSYEPGQVVRTDPLAGVSVNLRSDKVTVYYAGDKPTVMPDIVGYDYDTAVRRLYDAGFTEVSYEWVDNPGGQYAPNTAIGARGHKTGDNVYGNPAIVVQMAKNPAMPAVIGATEERARELLGALANSPAKVNVNINVVYEPSSRDNGIVHNASINEGDEVTPGANITLYVTRNE